tara:strand:+ start:1048 stop:1281 length:234 start_codon:yes stop_codon:yes gene_type:complete
VGFKTGKILKRLIYLELTFIIQIIKYQFNFSAGRDHSITILVRKEEICVLGLVFPVGKPIKMLFNLLFNFDKNHKLF